MNQLGFSINTDKCVACRSCVMACKEKQDMPVGRKFRRLFSYSGGGWQSTDVANTFQLKDYNGNATGVLKAYNPQGVFSFSLSMGCNHCEKPACLTSCPSQAIGKRSDGIVFIDRELCTGCQSCHTACPYKVPSFNEGLMKMEKCDFCRELIDIGETPHCVAACSMNALEYGDINVLKHLGLQQIADMPDAAQTVPSICIVPHRKYTVGMELISSNMPEETLANMPEIAYDDPNYI